MPYGAWSSTIDLTTSYLLDAYKALLRGEVPDPEFLLSLMVFLPKGEEPDDDDYVIRDPSSTRPLNLSNSDAKIATKLIDMPMSESAQVMVTPSQFGFVRGRRLHDAVLCLESWAMSYAVSAPASAGLILLDQKAAFPSIAHDFLFFILLEIGIPQFIVNAIRILYANNEAIVNFLGCRSIRVSLQRGVKHGCPLSGSIWVSTRLCDYFS